MKDVSRTKKVENRTISKISLSIPRLKVKKMTY